MPAPSASPIAVPPGNPSSTDPYLVRDIRPGPASSLADPAAGQFFELRGRAYFVADDGVHGLELWASDGTAEGTGLVADICPGACGSLPTSFISHAGMILFQADDGSRGQELWATDGTADGTRLVADIRPGRESASPVMFTPLGDRIVFEVTGVGSSRELWQTNGGAAGTRFVAQIAPPGAPLVPGAWQAANGVVYFGSHDGVTGRELWVTDGTQEGTGLVRDICPGPCDAFPEFAGAVLGREVFFAARSRPDTPTELWVSDGTARGTRSLGIVHPVGPPPAALGDFVLFNAQLPTGAQELWRTDGTTGGTRRVGIAPIFVPIVYFEWRGRMLLAVFTDPFGEELGVTDGTAAGTAFVEIVPGNSGSVPRGFVAHGDLVYFGTTAGLWRTDGTFAGTARVTTTGTAPSISVTRFQPVSAGGRLYFAAGHPAAGFELWAYRP